MSIMACSYCGDFTDTDDGEGMWDVKKINSEKVYDLVCWSCVEKYVDEEGLLNPELMEAA